MAEVLVGWVNVESGCLQIGDPCVGEQATREDVYRAAGICEALDAGDVEVTPGDLASHVLIRESETTMAVAHLCLTATGGDGILPVYATVGRSSGGPIIQSIRIDLSGECPDEEEWQRRVQGPAKRLHV